MAVPPRILIADRYSVELTQPLPELGGGLPAFGAVDHKGGEARLVAIAASRHASPRLRCLQILQRPIDNLMVPVAHGVGPGAGGGQGYYVICSAPVGRPVSAGLEPWPEGALLESALRPIAQVLIALQEAGISHRAIRPTNVFAVSPNNPVTMGAAWAAPPAMHQPVVYEPPFSALCHPAGRGEGSIADDIYALGVLLVTLATGRVPMADQDDDTIIRRKLELGSFAVLTAGANIPPYTSDLLRGMLADDPDHRSPARLLMDPTTARARRVAARPPRRSLRPLTLNDIAIFDARSLAYSLSRDERKSVLALRAGTVSQWLRRGLGDGGLAAAIEELVRVRMAEGTALADADTRLLMHAISTVEPRMPFCWREVAFWPDALGTLLAEGLTGDRKLAMIVEEVIRSDVLSLWDGHEADQLRDDGYLTSYDGRQARGFLQRNGDSALLRLCYGMNPLLPCEGAGMQQLWVIELPEMVAFLEHCATAEADGELLDNNMLAFIAARGDRQTNASVNLALGALDPAARQIRLLGLLRDLQIRHYHTRLPGLAAWAASRVRPRLETFQNRRTRASLLDRLNRLAAEGFLREILALAEDNAIRAEDLAGGQQAAAMIAAIDVEMHALQNPDRARRGLTAQLGREASAAIGMAALIVMLIIAAIE
jgi:hypothetical protein